MIRANLTAVAPDYHGAIDFAELREWNQEPDNIIDFSVNSNPYGPVKSVGEAISNVPLDRYPDKACLILRESLSHHFNLPMEKVLVGNGTAELLWLVAFACLQPGDNVMIIGPTFGEYARNAKLMGAKVVTWQANPVDNFAIDTLEIERLLAKEKPSLVHLCNPNNPTGQVVSIQTISNWARQYPQILFVIDEAYASFVPQFLSAMTLECDNLIVLRSMTKDYALAGLRLGYAVGASSLIRGLAQVQPPWSVNGLAQVAGIAALSAQSEYQIMWQQLRQETAVFREGLEKIGYFPTPSITHYFLMNVGNGYALREKLLRQGILVRLCESYQLPAYVRIATRTKVENDHLLKALAQIGETEEGM